MVGAMTATFGRPLDGHWIIQYRQSLLSPEPEVLQSMRSPLGEATGDLTWGSCGAESTLLREFEPCEDTPL